MARKSLSKSADGFAENTAGRAFEQSAILEMREFAKQQSARIAALDSKLESLRLAGQTADEIVERLEQLETAIYDLRSNEPLERQTGSNPEKHLA